MTGQWMSCSCWMWGRWYGSRSARLWHHQCRLRRLFGWLVYLTCPRLLLVELEWTISSYCGGSSVSILTSVWPTASSYDGGGSSALPGVFPEPRKAGQLWILSSVWSLCWWSLPKWSKETVDRTWLWCECPRPRCEGFREWHRHTVMATAAMTNRTSSNGTTRYNDWTPPGTVPRPPGGLLSRTYSFQNCFCTATPEK